MATTYTLISSQILASSAANITFSAIPSTFTDLVLKVSARSDSSAGGILDYLDITYNGDTTSTYSATNIYSNGSTVASYRDSNVSPSTANYEAYSPSAGATANTFSSVEFYIPNYTSTANKQISLISVIENNATLGYIVPLAQLWRGTAAITSIKLESSLVHNLVTGSSFYLYGISNA
jgi:hypothetical protein